MAMRILSMLIGALVAIATVVVPSDGAAADTDRGVVTGAVRAADGGEWVAGERVIVWLWNGSFYAYQQELEPGVEVYEFADVVPGDYSIRVRYYGDRPILGQWSGEVYDRDEAEAVTVEAGAVTTVDFSLPTGGRIEGHLSADTGSIDYSQARVSVSTQHDSSVSDAYATVSEDGSYTTSALAPGTYALGYQAPGYQRVNHAGVPWPWPEGTPPSERIPVDAGEVVTLDVELERMASISGTVLLDRDGVITPASSGRVFAKRFVDGVAVVSYEGGVAPDGTYSVVGLVPGDYQLTFRGPDSLTLPETRVELLPVGDRETVTGVDEVLIVGGTLSGVVVGPSGAPLADATVDLWRLDESSGYFVPVSDLVVGPSSEYGPNGKLGTFHTRTLMPGIYAMYTFGSPYGPYAPEYFDGARYFAERTDVVVTAEAEIDLGPIALEPRTYDVWRVAGVDRFATAVEVSALLQPEGRAPVVYVTDGYKFPDALAAGPAASRQQGVILTTYGDRLPRVVAREIARLDPLRVVVLGDAATISPEVEAEITGIVSEDALVQRIGGQGRYETGAMIVRDAFGESGSPYAIIATGQNYPDALAAGPAAAAVGAPVVLVDGRRGLDQATRDLLQELGTTDVIIAGGEPSVSVELEDALRALLGEDHVLRAAGSGRYETAAIINEFVFVETDHVVLATGEGFADALTGGPLAAAIGAPLYLSRPACIPGAARTGMQMRQSPGVWLLGGPTTLGSGVEQLARC